MTTTSLPKYVRTFLGAYIGMFSLQSAWYLTLGLAGILPNGFYDPLGGFFPAMLVVSAFYTWLLSIADEAMIYTGRQSTHETLQYLGRFSRSPLGVFR